MTRDDAEKHAERLNKEGAHREQWFYYPVCHDGGTQREKARFFGEWFVMRRPKRTPIHVAIFADGRTSRLEQ